MLEGKLVNLRVAEKGDIDFQVEFNNDIDSWGEYDSAQQMSKSEMIKLFDNLLAAPIDFRVFIIQKKDGTKIGDIHYRFVHPCRWMEIVYALIPSERGKGYGTEAIQLVVDYLFLSKDLVRIQAITDVRNKTSQRVLEKAGFQREGTIRRCVFDRGKWRDWYLYSILREEWKEPKILTKTA